MSLSREHCVSYASIDVTVAAVDVRFAIPVDVRFAQALLMNQQGEAAPGPAGAVITGSTGAFHRGVELYMTPNRTPAVHDA